MNVSIRDFDIRSILKDVVQNLFIIFLAGITALLAVYSIYTLSYKPKYTSSATLAVNIKGNNGGTYSSLYLTKEMASVFTEVFESDALKKLIAEDMGQEKMNGTIQFNLIPETNLFTLDVISDTPKHSFAIIHSALKNYDVVSDYLFSNASLQTLKSPTIPVAPSNPIPMQRNCALAFLLGIIGATAVVVLISFFRATVKNVSDAKNKLDGEVLGAIPYVKKYTTKRENADRLLLQKNKKNALLITSARLGMPFLESVKKISTIVEHHMHRRQQKVLLVTSAAENEGKSSVVANMALALADKGYKTLIIDADLRKPAIHKIFQKQHKNTGALSEFLSGNTNKISVVPLKSDKLYCVPQYRGLRDSSTLLSSERAKHLVDTCRKQFDYVLIDTSPLGLVTDAEILLQYSDAALITVREDCAPVGVINDITDVICKYDVDFLGFVLNAVSDSSIRGGIRTQQHSMHKNTAK